MKRRARERLPKRAAGSFPAYLYQSLDDLEGAWGNADLHSSGLVWRSHGLHRKRLLLLTDEEAGLTLRQRIGLPWILTLVVLRLRQDPMRLGEVYDSGDLLRYALQLPYGDWAGLADELAAIAEAVVATLPETPDHLPLIVAHRHFKEDR